MNQLIEIEARQIPFGIYICISSMKLLMTGMKKKEMGVGASQFLDLSLLLDVLASGMVAFLEDAL